MGIAAFSVGSWATGHHSVPSQVMPQSWAVGRVILLGEGVVHFFDSSQRLMIPYPGPEPALTSQKVDGEKEGATQTLPTLGETAQQTNNSCPLPGE